MRMRTRAYTHTPKGLRSVTKNLAILCLVSVLLQYGFALTPFAQDRAAEMLCVMFISWVLLLPASARLY